MNHLPAGLKDHTGRPVPEDAAFFQPPPTDIGEVTSASTTLKVGQKGVTPEQRKRTRRICVAVGVVVGLLIDLTPAIGNWVFVWPPLLGTVGVFAADLIVGRFEHWCSYIGRDGAIAFLCQNSVANIISRTLLKYDDVDDVAFEIRVERNFDGTYKWTGYSLTWTEAGVAKGTGGMYFKAKGLPERTDHFHFCKAAQSEWAPRYLARELKRQGYVELRSFIGVKESFTGPGKIRIAPDYIEFHSGPEVSRFSRDDIDTLAVESSLKLVANNRQSVTFHPAPGQAGLLAQALEKVFRVSIKESAIENATGSSPGDAERDAPDPDAPTETTRVPCAKCSTPILAATARRTGGLCMPCKQGTRR